VRKHRHDFLDVMRHQNQRRRIFLRAEPLEKLQEMFARGGIQPGARLVENQNARLAISARPISTRWRSPCDSTRHGASARCAHSTCRNNFSAWPFFRRASARPQKSIIAYLPLATVSSAGSSSGHHLPHGRADEADFFRSSRQSDSP
jgi:hypothetical protein